jgi:hypothetical protein
LKILVAVRGEGVQRGVRQIHTTEIEVLEICAAFDKNADRLVSQITAVSQCEELKSRTQLGDYQ